MFFENNILVPDGLNIIDVLAVEFLILLIDLLNAC